MVYAWVRNSFLSATQTFNEELTVNIWVAKCCQKRKKRHTVNSTMMGTHMHMHTVIPFLLQHVGSWPWYGKASLVIPNKIDHTNVHSSDHTATGSLGVAGRDLGCKIAAGQLGGRWKEAKNPAPQKGFCRQWLKKSFTKQNGCLVKVRCLRIRESASESRMNSINLKNIKTELLGLDNHTTIHNHNDTNTIHPPKHAKTY